MDGQKLEQLSSSSGIPLELLSRSIQARAEASGVTSDDILNRAVEMLYQLLLQW